MPDPSFSHELPILRELGDDLKRAFDAHANDAVAPRRARSRLRPLSIVPRINAGRLASHAAIAISVLLVVAIAGVALTLRGQTGPSRSPATTTSQPPASATPAAQSAAQRALRNELAVLRRPQTAADRHAYTVFAERRNPFSRRVIASSARLVRLPDRAYILLFLKRATAAGATRGPAGLPILGYSERSGANGLGSCCLSAGMLQDPIGPENENYFSSTPSSMIYFEIVPDDVAHVRWIYPRRPSYDGTRTPSSRTFPPLTITLAAHNNIAAAKLPDRGNPATVTWLAADGHTLATKHAKR